MRRLLIMLFVAVLATSSAWAQFSVEDENKSLQEKVVIGNAGMKSIATSTSYQSDARDRLERKRIRKEHNYLELTAQLNAEMWMYNNAWLERRGGDNTIAVSGRVFLKHVYTKDKFGITTQLEGNYGYNHIRIELEDADGNTYKKGNWFKNIDTWWFQMQPSRSIKNNWSYSGLLKLRSQISKSYSSRKDQTDENVLTSFMAPGYIDISVGVKYVSPNQKFPIQITLDPLASSGTIAYNDLVEANYRAKNAQNWFGIEMGKHATFSGGSKVNIAFSRKWGKNDWFEYWTNCAVYYGWITNVVNHNKIREWYDYQAEKRVWDAAAPAEGQTDLRGPAPVAKPYHVELHPTVEWKNTFTIRTAKYLTTTMQINLFYNKAVSDRAEIQSYLKLGLAYTIRNK